MLPTVKIVDYITLLHQYNGENRKYIMCLDFDKTLCYSNYPSCGDPITPVVEYVKYIQQADMTTILWTCREGKALEDAVKWCEQNDIRIDYVNEQGEFDKNKWKDTRKVFCNLLIDDTSYNFNVADFADFMEDVKK